MVVAAFSTSGRATSPADLPSLDGLLDGLTVGSLQTRGVMEVVGLRRVDSDEGVGESRDEFAVPSENLKLVQVPTYGAMLLRNLSATQTLVVPMHVGFFQHGAQHHATSCTLVLGPGETLRADDCFCIQAAQGGYLQEAEQRFLMLPAGLRPAALSHRGTVGCGRLWSSIDGFTRQFGVARGGHLERFLRPYFSRLVTFRHAFEPTPRQAGAAYFIAGELVGVEVVPHTAYFHDLFPILSIYCYGPSALLAERQGIATRNEPVDLDGLRDLDDLEARLNTSRESQRTARTRQLAAVSNGKWTATLDEERHGLKVVTVEQPGWMGQTVRRDGETVALSIFRSPAGTKGKSAFEPDF
jgi:hypothetical protein